MNRPFWVDPEQRNNVSCEQYTTIAELRCVLVAELRKPALQFICQTLVILELASVSPLKQSFGHKSYWMVDCAPDNIIVFAFVFDVVFECQHAIAQ